VKNLNLETYLGKVLKGAIPLCFTIFIKWFIQSNTTQYTVNNTQFATCFSYNEPSSGQYLLYGHGVFSECVQYCVQYCSVTLVTSIAPCSTVSHIVQWHLCQALHRAVLCPILFSDTCDKHCTVQYCVQYCSVTLVTSIAHTQAYVSTRKLLLCERNQIATRNKQQDILP
jgi:hypothetical protein